MQSVKQYIQEYYNRDIKPFLNTPFLMGMYDVLSVIILKIVLIIKTIYNFCKKYGPEVYKFLYAFIEALNNNYNDDLTDVVTDDVSDGNNIDNNNSPKKPIIDSCWCNVDIKNIITKSNEDVDNCDDVNDDDDVATLQRPPPDVWDDDIDNEVNNDTSNDVSNSDVIENIENTSLDINEENKKNN
jgi:hypothetical protein